MCGIAGFFSLQAWTYSDSPDLTLKNMGTAILSRGPDADGIYYNSNINFGFVHRRLSIQDLSPLGAQPMTSSSGRYVISFNGEIYNFKSLKKELIYLGHIFKGHSDTEVMLASFEEWGVVRSLSRFTGMFAFSLIDLMDSKLYLARDRMGEKPLYYGFNNGYFLFASELKALKAHPAWQGKINKAALPSLLRHNFICAPHTIYENIFKLPPASFISLDFGSINSMLNPTIQRYWELESYFNPVHNLSMHSASIELERLLMEVIGDQMISDVPLGAFLSGGVDSSAVVALMQRQAIQPVKTFTIGFDEPGFNEAEHAKSVANHLKTEHTELYITANDALSVIPSLPNLYDEPFADSSQIPTLLVSRMTREHVTVALSGDGGDELFCGYSRYQSTINAWNNRFHPVSLARSSLGLIPSKLVCNLIRYLVPGQRHRRDQAILENIDVFSKQLQSSSLSDFYRSRNSYWIRPFDVLLADQEPDYALTSELPVGIGDDPFKKLMWRDLNWYLPDDILVKVDRAAMSCSLETRVPMLDRRIVEFALHLPSALNIKNNVGKQVLREVLYRHVPRQLIDRPKQGFAIPLDAWLRGPLKEWGDTLLNASRMEQEGFWNASRVRWYWDEHQRGIENYAFKLWSILMFQAWLNRQ